MNGIDVIVRSHQCVKEGRGFEVMHDQHLVRVFSARDYEGHRNDASIISIRKDRTSLNRVQLVLRMHGLRSLVRLENEVSQMSLGPNDEAWRGFQARPPYRPDSITLVRARPSCEHFCLTKQLPKCGKFEYNSEFLLIEFMALPSISLGPFWRWHNPWLAMYGLSKAMPTVWFPIFPMDYALSTIILSKVQQPVGQTCDLESLDAVKDDWHLFVYYL